MTKQIIAFFIKIDLLSKILTELNAFFIYIQLFVKNKMS